MPIDAILFDLDDTLIVDEAVSKEALQSTAQLAAKLTGVDTVAFLADCKRFGFSLWKDGPCYDYVRSIGISYHECLWGNFDGDKPELVKRTISTEGTASITISARSFERSSA